MNDNNKHTNPSKSPAFIPQNAGGDLGMLKPINMEIKVLGPGCPKCKTLEKATLEAVSQTGIDATVSKVDDIVEIMNYGVMSTPALVINGKVVVKGRVPSIDEIKTLIRK